MALRKIHLGRSHRPIAAQQTTSGIPTYSHINSYLYSATLGPVGPIGPLILGDAFLPHFDAGKGKSKDLYRCHQQRVDIPVSFVRIVGNVVSPFIIDRTRGHKMLVQMVDIFQDVPFHRSRYGNVINQTERSVTKMEPDCRFSLPQMNHIFAQTHTSSMWTNDHTKFSRHQQHAQNLTNTRKTTRVNLTNINSLSLQQLFEHHSIMSVFSRRHSNPVRLQCFANGRMSEDIIWSSWLFNKPADFVSIKYRSFNHRHQTLTMV